MKTVQRIGAIGASVALAAGAVAFAVAPAGAAGSFSSAITGGLDLTTTTGSSNLAAAADSLMTGNYDPDAGTLTGSLALGNTTFTTTVGGNPVDVDISFTSGGNITGGTVTGTAVSFTDTETVNLDKALAIALAPCSVGPVTLDYTGTYDSATGDVDVTSNVVDVPALTGSCAGLASTIAPMLAGATVQSHLMFNIGTPDAPGPTETAPSTTTSTTTVPVQPETTVDDANITSKGCDVTIPIDFGEAGTYSVMIVTSDKKIIGSTKVTRDAAGSYDVHVSVDPNHGTHTGDPLTFTVDKVDGTSEAQVAEAPGEVTDASACTPTISSGTTSSVGNTAATPVSATPAYTG